MTRGIFISGTGTSVGKTYVGRALATSLRAMNLRVAALKPAETGCVPRALDAEALARASGDPELAFDPGFYRAELPLAPDAVALEGGPQPPSPEDLAAAAMRRGKGADVILVEGAGGILVPLDARHTFLDVGRALGLPILLVAPNVLGVLSHVMTAASVVVGAGQAVAAVVLVEASEPEPSHRTNPRILEERLGRPVFTFPRCPDDDAALGKAAFESGLTRAVLGVCGAESTTTPFA